MYQRLERIADLQAFAKELNSKGFTILAPSGQIETYFKFAAKNGALGYVQAEHFSGFSFTTVHRPNNRTGTGFSVISQTDQLTMANALLTANMHAPAWASQADRASVVKYKSVEEFIRLEPVLKWKVVEFGS